MDRLDTYCKLLEGIYGKRIVELFTIKNENTLKLTMNNEEDNQKAKRDYVRKEGEGCSTCQSIFRNPNFFKRNLEFPGWIGYLNFSGTIPAKEIMVIGEAPTPLEEQINIAFGLGLYHIERDGKLNADQLKEIYKQVKRNKLWEYLNLLFLKRLDIIKSKIYITDLCKCNDDIEKDGNLNKNQRMWTKCFSKCLIKEINLINPSLIIFQGWDSYKYVMKYLEEHGLIESKREFYSNQLQSGKFPLNGKNIYFFKIHHQAYFYSRLKDYERSNYINQNLQFIEKEILKEVLNIN